MPIALSPLGSRSATRIDGTNDTVTKVKVFSGGKVYYKSTENVSSASKDGTLESGQSVTVSSPTYFISESESRLSIEQVPFASKGLSRWPVVYGATPEVGNDTAYVSGSIFYATVAVNFDCTVTGVEVLNGTVAETNKLIGILYDRFGQVVANSKTEGITASGAKTYQALEFTAPALVPAGKYFIGVQANGTTAKFYSLKKGTTNIGCGSTTGTFGTVAAITPPTTFTENVAPIANTY
jgi:hypothetical protein